MVRFFAERKTKATRTDAARGFPTFAHRRGHRFAARRCVVLGRFLSWCRERKKKKSGALDKFATGGGRCDRDLGARKRFRGEWSSDEENDAVVVAERWGGGVPTRRIPMPFFLFRLGLSLLGNRGKRESKCFGCTTKWCLHQLCERRARAFDDGFFPRFFLRTLPTSQRTDDNDAFFSHSSTGYRSRSWRPQQKDEAHQAKV